MLECVTPEDIQAVFKGLVDLAKDGHWQAAKLVLAYTIGKPQAVTESLDLFDDLARLGEAALPSTNNEMEEPPSTNGEIQEQAPSTNGEIAEPPPSTTGETAPRNRQERRAFRKAYRLTKQQRNTPQPAPAV